MCEGMRGRSGRGQKLSRSAFLGLEEPGCLNEPPVLAEAGVAGPLHNVGALAVEHRPLKQALAVMLEKAVVAEAGTRELLLALGDALGQRVRAVNL